MSDAILIVDDDPETRKLLGDLLAKRGFAVLRAESGVAALEHIYSRRVDLVILDVLMQEMSGIEVCETLRAHPVTKNLPIMVLSARSEVQVKVAAIEAGADEYLTKPISPTELEARVRGLLDRTRRLLEDALPRGSAAGPGAVLCFVGAKGGVGTSTVALNVAAVLAGQDHSVIAAEMAPFYGGYAQQLQQEPLKNISGLARLGPGALTVEAVGEALYRFPGGMRVLFGPQTAAECDVNSGREWTLPLVDAMSAMDDMVVLDMGAAPSTSLRAVARRAQLIGLVMEPESMSIEAGRRWLDLFNLWGVSSGLVGAVVVNRSPSVATINATEVGRVLGCRTLGVVPEATQLCEAAQEAGEPMVLYQPTNVVSTNIVNLTAKVVEMLA